MRPRAYSKKLFRKWGAEEYLLENLWRKVLPQLLYILSQGHGEHSREICIIGDKYVIVASQQISVSRRALSLYDFPNYLF